MMGTSGEALNAQSTVLTVEAAIFLFVLVGLVSYKLLTGEINNVGLLSDKTTQQMSPARVQLLMTTLLGVGYFCLSLFDPKNAGKLPDVPQEFLLLLGGSHSLYLGSKSLPLLLQTLLHGQGADNGPA
jgi:hypothetical protein